MVHHALVGPRWFRGRSAHPDGPRRAVALRIWVRPFAVHCLAVHRIWTRRIAVHSFAVHRIGARRFSVRRTGVRHFAVRRGESSRSESRPGVFHRIESRPGVFHRIESRPSEFHWTEARQFAVRPIEFPRIERCRIGHCWIVAHRGDRAGQPASS